jgi:hypothetical protein
MGKEFDKLQEEESNGKRRNEKPAERKQHWPNM